MELEEELSRLRRENSRLQEENQLLKARLGADDRGQPLSPDGGQACKRLHKTFLQSHSLNKEQVERYSRQLLLERFGVQAQDNLCKASVLIVGCGGLGERRNRKLLQSMCSSAINVLFCSL